MIANAIETERLLLRPWNDRDASSLYKYASDPDVGTPAGWQPHTSLDMSLEIIRTVFSAPETYAVVWKETNEPIGCCGIVPQGSRLSSEIKENDAEIGYWLGNPYWGNGIIPEAVTALIEHAKKSLNKDTFWIGFYDGNDKSRRVAEKCGFEYHHTEQSGSLKEHFYKKLFSK